MPITKTDIKKDGLQQYRVRVNYTDVHGNYRQAERTAYGLAEAKDLEARLLKELKEKTETPRITVAELYQEYMSAKKHEVRETSFDKTRRICEAVILPLLGTVRIDRLSSQVLQEWKNEIGQAPLSVTTKKNYYKELNALLRYAVKRSYLIKNPLDAVGNFKDVYFEVAKEKIHYYTPDEFLKYIAVARAEAEAKNDRKAWGLYVFFNVAFYTGMRKGEINALKWTDIDGDIIHVRRSITQKLKGEDRETPPKNKSSHRELQMPKPLKEILREHWIRQKQDERYTNGFRVCGGPECLRDTTVEKANQRFAEGAGLSHIRIHDFRHTHATVLVNEGINIQEIARRLGHADVKMTWNTYAHLYPREEERAVSILDKISGFSSPEKSPKK